MKLPLIVGFGGINSAGRSSGFHSYKRMVEDVLTDTEMESTWQDLARRMGLIENTRLNDKIIADIKAGTLIRRIDSFDPEKKLNQYKTTISSENELLSFTICKSKLPNQIPKNWNVREENNKLKITVTGDINALIEGRINFPVTSGGNIPSGFEPGKLYNSRFHPRGLKLAIYGASDALNSMGIDWDTVLQHVEPDKIAVYAGSALGQIDEFSLSGILSSSLRGSRVSSKMMAFSLAEMPADFINSYVINSIGKTGANLGACATFLYNLGLGVNDIKQGHSRVVIVGNAEAPVVAEIMEGFRVMGALAEDEKLKILDNSDQVDNRRSCRPFSNNVGFTMAESAQFVVLMEDTLALELGAMVYGSIADVFINADANKKSISSPGVGNYITVAKAVSLAQAILGNDGLKQTYVHAHGTGTPQNRITESHILNEVAKTFNINKWPVTAIKSYVGHSIGTASGDQLIASLGVWKYGWIPGIKTIDKIAEDVHNSNLNILIDHIYAGKKGKKYKGVIINAKGFGGNNASGLVLSPHQTMSMLKNKYGIELIEKYHIKNIKVSQHSRNNDREAYNGDETIYYNFSEDVMDNSNVTMTQKSIKLSTFHKEIPLTNENPFVEYCKQSG
ncbi:3-oxoacyl-(Acyl-carrier-protein) synthase I [Candidatus Photodesmus blepharus]|uniref:3-oxoacyl-(Acyl-carrier-protein) synthase I n=1 Tax=Candidatus Photodesmus blepharonis TaxID=1179155 RepID=A0A084CND4_9GAMM|nr:beta-ketoacyl synthase [Candidatus Photodesmus blepharus]KEY91313.1 3-oxoacyl-(Acyl-carrier-protein) synthase I [Candidatus Photodesmus blepharus]